MFMSFKESCHPSPVLTWLCVSQSVDKGLSLESPVRAQSTSRWELLMSPSRRSAMGPIFPGWKGAAEGTEGVCWLGQHEAGGKGWDPKRKTS